jgi:hypothetical protein
VTLFVSRFPPQENAQPIEPCSISKIELLHLRNILLKFILKINLIYIRQGTSSKAPIATQWRITLADIRS